MFSAFAAAGITSFPGSFVKIDVDATIPSNLFGGSLRCSKLLNGYMNVINMVIMVKIVESTRASLFLWFDINNFWLFG